MESFYLFSLSFACRVDIIKPSLQSYRKEDSLCTQGRAPGSQDAAVSSWGWEAAGSVPGRQDLPGRASHGRREGGTANMTQSPSLSAISPSQLSPRSVVFL